MYDYMEIEFNQEEFDRYVEEEVEPYCIYIIDQYGRKLYENSIRKGIPHWSVSKIRDNLRIHRGSLKAKECIRNRMFENRINGGEEIQYFIESIL